MAFTVTVTDRHDLDTEPGHGCDNSAGLSAASDSVTPGAVDDAPTIELSPLED